MARSQHGNFTNLLQYSSIAKLKADYKNGALADGAYVANNELFIYQNEVLSSVSKSGPTYPFGVNVGLSVLAPASSKNPRNIAKNIGALPAFATTYTAARYIDPEKVATGAGTYADPWNLVQFTAVAGTLSATSMYLFKRGTSFTCSVSMTGNSAAIGSYGQGPRPVWNSDSTGLCIQKNSPSGSPIIFGIEFVTYSTAGTNNRCIVNTAATPATATNLTIYDCKFSAPGGFTLTNERTPVLLHGANNKILFCEFDGIADDAVWCDGDNLEVAYCHFDNVGQSTTDPGNARGDCVQLAGAANNPWIHHNYMRNRTGAKQCVEGSVTPSGATALIEYNTIIHDYVEGMIGKAIKMKYVDCKIRFNYISGSNDSIWLEENGEVYGNVILNDNTRMAADSAAVHMLKNGGGIYKIYNNTIVSPKSIGINGIRLAFATTPGVGCVVQNNIIMGFQLGFSNAAAQVDFTVTNNIWFDNDVNSNYAYDIAATNFIVNPLLDEYFVPQEHLTMAIGITGAATDYYGGTFVKAIGAVQPDGMADLGSGQSLLWSVNGRQR